MPYPDLFLLCSHHLLLVDVDAHVLDVLKGVAYETDFKCMFHNSTCTYICMSFGCTLRTHLRDTGMAIETLVEFHKEQIGKSSTSASRPMSSRIHVQYWYYLARANNQQR